MANQYFLLLISLLDDLMSAYSLELQESNELPQHMSLESGLGGLKITSLKVKKNSTLRKLELLCLRLQA